jgi:hypothetical protein
MMGARLVNACIGIRLPAAQKLVLLCLADQANDRGENVMPDVPTLARWCGLSPRQIHRAIERLRTIGHLTEAHPAGSLMRYRLHPLSPIVPRLAVDWPEDRPQGAAQ